MKPPVGAGRVRTSAALISRSPPGKRSVVTQHQARHLVQLVRRGFRVIDESSTPQERTQAAVDAKQAGERIGRLKNEIAQLEKDRARYQQELDAYRTRVATR